MKKTLLITGLLLGSVNSAMAGDEPKSAWAGSTGYLGFSTTGGNSDTENLTAGLKIKRETNKWISDMGLDILRSSSNNIDTAERYVLSTKTGYKFNDIDYVFYGSRYEKDNFSAFDYTMTTGVGWGHKFYDTDTQRLITEVGIGYKIQALDIDRSEVSGIAFTGKIDYMRQLTDTMQFIDVLIVEATSDNTYFQNDAGLSLKVSDKVNVNFVHQIKHNTDVPAGFDNTDTLFAINLGYTF
jgi:putative salt-induced outer membrane protein